MTTLTNRSPKIDFPAATMAELVAFYNHETGKSIAKFETRAKGVARCLALVSGAPDLKPSGGAPVASAGTGRRMSVRETMASAPTAMSQLTKTVLATAVKKTSAPVKKVAASPAAPKPPALNSRAAFGLDAKITVLHKGDNPKRAAAADRYDLYRSGMTVAAYVAAGGQRRDVVWDQKMGWIKVGV